ncbi:hypothetical protein PS2_030 [Serratia phage PS2]|uniref:Uncharacterized protein n=1 Tax=Serratia phage PS2 TaxID=1481112 RepID=A0A023W4W3_9CAUD|nr:hypothetical protein FF83_gp030 [Serratia phage PS2]AHY25280.1 hypothetical protein PS2_030 [Serratia phage PS2]
MRSKIVSIELSQMQHVVNGRHRGLLIGKWEINGKTTVIPIGLCVVDGAIMPPGCDIPQARLKRFAFYPQNSVDKRKSGVIAYSDSEFPEAIATECDLIVGTDYTVNYVLGRYHDFFESSEISSDEKNEKVKIVLDRLINHFDNLTPNQVKASLQDMLKLVK